MQSTAGDDDTELLCYRTEPVRIEFDVEDAFYDFGLIDLYDRAEVVEAFTLTEEGERAPLADAVTNVRAASFPSAPQARAVTATAARPNGPTADRPGQLER